MLGASGGSAGFVTYDKRCSASLRQVHLEWKGWHAFRRGLATNLTDLGVRPEVIQRILRHGDLATTMRYVKTRAHRINDAMATFEAAVPAQSVLPDTFGTLNNETGARPVAVN